MAAASEELFECWYFIIKIDGCPNISAEDFAVLMVAAPEGCKVIWEPPKVDETFYQPPIDYRF